MTQMLVKVDLKKIVNVVDNEVVRKESSTY